MNFDVCKMGLAVDKQLSHFFFSSTGVAVRPAVHPSVNKLFL